MEPKWIEQLKKAKDAAGHTTSEAAHRLSLSRAVGERISPRTVESWVQGKTLRPTRENEKPIAKYIKRYLGEEVVWDE